MKSHAARLNIVSGLMCLTLAVVVVRLFSIHVFQLRPFFLDSRLPLRAS